MANPFGNLPKEMLCEIINQVESIEELAQLHK